MDEPVSLGVGRGLGEGEGGGDEGGDEGGEFRVVEAVEDGVLEGDGREDRGAVERVVGDDEVVGDEGRERGAGLPVGGGLEAVVEGLGVAEGRAEGRRDEAVVVVFARRGGAQPVSAGFIISY